MCFSFEGTAFPIDLSDCSYFLLYLALYTRGYIKYDRYFYCSSLSVLVCCLSFPFPNMKLLKHIYQATAFNNVPFYTHVWRILTVIFLTNLSAWLVFTFLFHFLLIEVIHMWFFNIVFILFFDSDFALVNLCIHICC